MKALEFYYTKQSDAWTFVSDGVGLFTDLPHLRQFGWLMLALCVVLIIKDIYPKMRLPWLEKRKRKLFQHPTAAWCSDIATSVRTAVASIGSRRGR